MHPPLDPIDAQILRLLQADGRLPKQKLAETIGLSAPATHERVKRLVDEGYILGFEAILNPAKLAAGMLVFAEVRLEYTGAGVADAFREAVQQRPEILECYEVAGSFDYMIKTRVADMAAYRDLVAAVVWRLPGVRDVRTFAVVEEVKHTARIAV